MFFFCIFIVSLMNNLAIEKIKSNNKNIVINFLDNFYKKNKAFFLYVLLIKLISTYF